MVMSFAIFKKKIMLFVKKW